MLGNKVMKIGHAIVSGGTGPIGVALIKYLHRCDISVIVLARQGSVNNHNIPKLNGVTILEYADFDAFNSIAEKIQHNCDAFFHLAWNTSSREVTTDPFSQTQCIRQTLNSVRLANALGCRVFVGAGSQAEYGRTTSHLGIDTQTNPETSYGIAKYAAGRLSQLLCETLGLRHCWCRILSVYGPYDRNTTAIMYCINSLLKRQKPSFTKAEQTWDYIYSVDCAKALYMIGKNGKHGRYYPIGSGGAQPLIKYFESIRDLIDPSLPIGIGEKDYHEKQLMSLCSDISMLTLDTGFVPEYTFEMGIRETIEWVKKQVIY